MSVDEFLSKEKLRVFKINLTGEELEQISLCRRGIIGASGIGAIFGFFGGRIALGPVPSSILLKSVVITGNIDHFILYNICNLHYLASFLTGIIVGAGVSIQQSYNYLKSKPTNLATELQNFSYLILY